MRSISLPCMLILIAFAAHGQQVPPSTKTSPEQRSAPVPKGAMAVKAPAPLLRGSEQSPVVVKLQNTGKSSADNDEDRVRFDTMTSIDWKTMAFTGGLLLIASFQLFLFAFQLNLMRAGSKTGTAAAQAAAKNAAAVQAATEPYLYPEIVVAAFDQSRGAARPQVVYEIRNYGKTPGILTRFSDAMLFTNQLPEGPNFLEPPEQRPERVFLIRPDAQATDRIICELPQALSPDQYREQVARGWRIYVVGILRYEDFLGMEHNQWFCVQVLLHDGNRFQSSYFGGKQYNFRTSQKSDG